MDAGFGRFGGVIQVKSRIWDISQYPNLWGFPQACLTSLEKNMPYLTQFLVDKHPYRKGAVCPFMPGALHHKQVFVAGYDPEEQGYTDTLLDDFVKRCIAACQARKAPKRKAAVVMVFPDTVTVPVLLRCHVRLKAYCVSQQMMIGVLWRDSPAASLHSQQFFPLRTPTPIIVVRDLSVKDLIFLDPQFYSVRTRLQFLKSYIDCFQHSPAKIVQKQIGQAQSLVRAYKKQLWCCYGVVAACVLFILYRCVCF